MSARLFMAAGALALCASLVPAQAETRAFIGARILPISSPAIDDGVLLIEDDRIAAVGARGEVSIPGDAERVELAPGSVIMPGLVDSHSHIGEVSGADRSGPIQPEARAFDAVNVRSSGIKRALAGGITSVNVMPGSGHLISGQTLYMKLRDGQSVADLAYRFEDGSPAGGLKMANGTNPIGEAPFPGTRAKSAALARAAYLDAMAYRDKRENAPADKKPARDLGKEALLEVLDGKRMVHFHTHRHDDIDTVLRLREEFGFRVVLHHTSEAWRMADRIAEAEVPVSLIIVDSPGGKLEARHLKPRNASALEDAGVVTALHTDDWITDSRYFTRMAGFAVRAGMSRDTALRALTLTGAEMLDLDDRVGSLQAGKDADFVVFSGDPLSVYSRVQQTWVEGKKRFDLSNPDDRLVAEGGAGALQDEDATAHMHAHGR